METFSTLLAICARNSPVTGEFPAQWPVTRAYDVFFDMHHNKRLSKQWWGCWFETPSRPLWRHCNEPDRSGTLWYVYVPRRICAGYIYTSRLSLKVVWGSRLVTPSLRFHKRVHDISIFEHWNIRTIECINNVFTATSYWHVTPH